MPKIKLEQLRSGMVVAADVKNMDNMLLLPSGCVLSERHLDILSSWGISEIQVEAGDGVEDGDILKKLPAPVLERITGELRAIFWEPVDKGPIQTEIFNLLLRRKAQQVLGNKGGA